jgi:hypothetical protein
MPCHARNTETSATLNLLAENGTATLCGSGIVLLRREPITLKTPAKTCAVTALKEELAEMKRTVHQLAEVVKDTKQATLPSAPAHTGERVLDTLTAASLQH